MAKRYLKVFLTRKNFNFEEKDNSFIIDCSGNDMEFMRAISMINRYVEEWTYDLGLDLNIKINTAFERIVIECWGI